MDFRKHWWSISIIIIVFGLFCIVIPITAWNGKLDTKSVIEIVSIVVSWPVAICLIGLLFIFRFQSAIDAYLRNIGLMKLPGGFEIQSQQSIKSDSSVKGSADNLVLTPEQQKNIEDFIGDLESKQKLTEEEKGLLSHHLDYVSHIAIEWKFRFLDLFFVYNTKRVLHWFSANSPQTKDSYFTIWQQTISNNEQRTTILNILIQYGFLLKADGLFHITDHGYSFLQFIDLIPPTPKATIG